MTWNASWKRSREALSILRIAESSSAIESSRSWRWVVEERVALLVLLRLLDREHVDGAHVLELVAQLRDLDRERLLLDGQVSLGERRGRVGRGQRDGLLALPRQVVEVGAGARPLHVHLRERVLQHVALAPALLQPQLAALDPRAALAHALLGARRLAAQLVAADERLGEQPLDLGELGHELLAPRRGLGGARARGGDPLLELREVGLEPPAVVLGRGRALAQRREPALGLGVARLGRLGRGAAGGDGGRELGEQPRAFRALQLGRPERRLELRELLGRGRPVLLGLPALGIQHGGLAVEARGFVVGRLDLVARRDQLLLGAVDLLVEPACLERLGRRGRDGLRGVGAQRDEPHLELRCRAATSFTSRRGASRPLTLRPPSTMAPRSVSPSSVTTETGPWRAASSSAFSSVATTIASGSEARIRSACGPLTR